MFTYQNAMMNHPLICLLLSLLVASANGQAPQEEPQTPPPMGMGKGKGKGKGKGRPMPTPPTTPPAPGPTPAPTTPPAPTPAPAPAPVAAGNASFYEQKILPVLQNKCFECHQTGRKTKGGLALDSQATLMKGGETGPALIPGDAAKSLLYISMTYADDDLQMPPREQLSSAVLADFKKWIEMGAPFSSSGAAVATAPPPAEDGMMVTITAIRGNSVTYTKSESEGGMRGGMGMGKGKGKGGFSRGGEDGITQSLSDKALITSAMLTRRTQDLIVGLELSGGLSNEAFDAVKDGARAHLVVKDGQITELNLITAQEESDAPIAVKPKRPPSKSATLTP